jgi:hypothetical protein
MNERERASGIDISLQLAAPGNYPISIQLQAYDM